MQSLVQNSLRLKVFIRFSMTQQYEEELVKQEYFYVTLTEIRICYQESDSCIIF